MYLHHSPVRTRVVRCRPSAGCSSSMRTSAALIRCVTARRARSASVIALGERGGYLTSAAWRLFASAGRGVWVGRGTEGTRISDRTRSRNRPSPRRQRPKNQSACWTRNSASGRRPARTPRARALAALDRRRDVQSESWESRRGEGAVAQSPPGDRDTVHCVRRGCRSLQLRRSGGRPLRTRRQPAFARPGRPAREGSGPAPRAHRKTPRGRGVDSGVRRRTASPAPSPGRQSFVPFRGLHQSCAGGRGLQQARHEDLPITFAQHRFSRRGSPSPGIRTDG